MDEILKVNGLSKTFTLSRKQQKIEQGEAGVTSGKRIKVAVDNLTFDAYRGRALAIVRAGYEAGEAVLHVQAEGLEAQTVRIPVQA